MTKQTVTRRRALAGLGSAVLLNAASALVPAAASAAGLRGQGATPQLEFLKRTMLGPIAEIDGLEKPWRDADLGHLRVPMNWNAPAADQQAILRFARFRGPAGNKGAPVFWFSGGPSRTNDLFGFVEAPADIQRARRMLGVIDTVTAHRDLVLIDHRGSSGCIYPKLTPLGIHPNLPLDRPLSADERRERYREVNEEVIARWRALGVDLSHFNTPSLAMDVDAVRAALGYERIILAGASNGTYRCREYMRRFQSHVDAAILFIAHGYEKMPRPSHVAAALRRISADVAADAAIGRLVPRLEEMLDTIAARLAREHPRVTVTSPLDRTDKTVCLGPDDLVPYIWETLGNDASILSAPSRLLRVAGGDYKELAQSAIMMRFAGDTLYNFSAYELAFGGASFPADYTQRRSEAGARPYLNRELHDGLQTGWPLPRDPQAAFEHKIPIVHVQGDWDMRTPVEGVADLAASNSTVLRVPFSGHYNGLDEMIRPVITAVLTGQPMPVLRRRDRPVFAPPAS
jgi:pimeloyl-ACP methyl ester carboxylesterase